MAFVNLSPNMQLPIPAVGIEPGPQWASDINSSLTLLDQHNHTPGSGVAITPAAMNINVDLPFNSESAITLYSTQYIEQAANLSSSILRAVYFVGKELVINDGAGNPVQITSNGSVVGTPGSITGLTPPASVSYGSSTFVFQANANVAANLDGASLLLRTSNPSSPALTLSPPSAIASNYSITLPALPGATSFLTLDTSGNMAAGIAVTGGINTANIANSAITTAKIVDSAITYQKLDPTLRESALATGFTGTLFDTNPFAVMICPTVLTNTSSSYNASTGIYTVPTTGYLSLAAGIVVTGSAAGSTAITMRLMLNNAEVLRVQNVIGAYSPTNINGGVTLPLEGLTVAATDQVWLEVQFLGSNSTIRNGYVSFIIR